MPKLSVLIPVYNVEKLLRQCLESVVSQTLDDIEIICINDGSTDTSSQILEEFRLRDARIKVVNKENSGYGASMNMGLDLATGDYVGIVESDDFVAEDMFANLYELALKYDADVVKSDYYEFDTGRNLSRQAGKIPNAVANRVTNAKTHPLILKIMPSIWSVVYRREFLNGNNIRFLETPGASYQDTSFAFKSLSLAEKVFFTTKAYLHYRIDNENSSVRSKTKVFMICDEYAEITRFLDANPEIKSFANDVKLIKEYAAYIWNFKRLSEEYRSEFVERVSDVFGNYSKNGELNKNFYKKYPKKEIDMLLNDKKAYLEYLQELCKKDEQRRERRRKFSLRINHSRVSVVLAGKEIVRIE